MTFLAIFFALLFEQVRPLGAHSAPHQLARLWVLQMLRSFDAGQALSARLGWALIVLAPALLATALHYLLQASDNWLGWLLLFALHVGVLYLTLGFRQFSAYFTTIRDALDQGDENTARATLAQWAHGTPPQGMTAQRSDILRAALAQASLSAHIHVFGVMVAYSLGAMLGLGPAGAVAYRLCELLARYCSQQQHHAPANLSNSPADAPEKPAISAPMQSTAQNAWQILDWLPTRITALLFAIVGNFEDAIACWRAQSQRSDTPPAQSNAQLLVSAAAGAIGVQMAWPATSNPFAGAADEDPSSSLNPPQLGHLQAMVGLVWRSVLVWMTLLALVTVAGMA